MELNFSTFAFLRSWQGEHVANTKRRQWTSRGVPEVAMGAEIGASSPLAFAARCCRVNIPKYECLRSAGSLWIQ